jgi:hypothetical protein
MSFRITLIGLLALSVFRPAGAEPPGTPGKTTSIFDDTSVAPKQAAIAPSSPSKPAPARGDPIPVSRRAPSADSGRPIPKSPAPNLEDQKAARKLVDEVFKDEVARARDPKESTAVVKRLVDAALAERNPATNFVLLAMARDVAAQAGDLQAACNSVDLMDVAYIIDVLQMKADAAAFAAKAPLTTETREDYLARSEELADDAVVAERFDVARRLGDLAMAVARTAGEPESVRRVSERIRLVRESEAGFAQVKKAAATLAAGPADPQAVAIVGRYRCLIKSDWAGGLPLLAQGAGGALATLAQADLADPATSEAQLKLADDWWQLAEKEKGIAQRSIHRHAQVWYVKALPGLTGLAKVKVEKRLEGTAPLPTQRVAKAADLNEVTVHFSAEKAELGTLAEGERYLTNRKYVLKQIPEMLKNLAFTRRPGGKASEVAVDVPAGATVYALVERDPGPLHELLLGSGWSKVAEIPVTDQRLELMVVFGKTFEKPAHVQLTPQGFVGIMLAAKHLRVAEQPQ